MTSAARTGAAHGYRVARVARVREIPWGATMSARRPTILLAVLVCVLAAGCSGKSSSGDAAATSSANTALHLVSLGDSDATGIGDEEGTGWVQRYADLVAQQTGTDVEVVAHAQEGLTSDALLADLGQDTMLQQDVRSADLVVIGAGGADLNAGDDAWDVGTCSGTAC